MIPHELQVHLVIINELLELLVILHELSRHLVILHGIAGTPGNPPKLLEQQMILPYFLEHLVILP